MPNSTSAKQSSTLTHSNAQEPAPRKWKLSQWLMALPYTEGERSASEDGLFHSIVKLLNQPELPRIRDLARRRFGTTLPDRELLRLLVDWLAGENGISDWEAQQLPLKYVASQLAEADQENLDRRRAKSSEEPRKPTPPAAEQSEVALAKKKGKLRPCCEKAYRQYQRAQARNPDLKTDQDTYVWIEAEGNASLPDFANWSRYLRQARQHYASNKRGPQKSKRASGKT